MVKIISKLTQVILISSAKVDWNFGFQAKNSSFLNLVFHLNLTRYKSKGASATMKHQGTSNNREQESYNTSDHCKKIFFIFGSEILIEHEK